MKKLPFEKYRPFPPVDLPSRRWPSNVIKTAPVWCSVDLRDGNQALIDPMTVEQKLAMFELLTKINFKEIEIGFPAASETEYEFCRRLTEENRIPPDVKVQVLCQAREHLIEKTFRAIKGMKRVIFHLYNSTSALQRDVVFNASVEEIKHIALRATHTVKSLRDTLVDCRLNFQYSPESFTGTELPVALEICGAIVDKWDASPKDKVILNLPATVEMSTPNIYADMIEWMHTRLKKRDSVILSLHPHNDRGCAVAATELGLMAGADRVEGTLFGNGERTGNVDICTLAFNMYSQGIDPELYLGDIDKIQRLVEECTRLPIHPRHPYVGELVYTAFSGSHQDAINKGLKRQKMDGKTHWSVPYLPIDPQDLNRTYEAVIRINSQSGKGGVAYVLESNYGFKIPRSFQIHFSKAVQAFSDKKKKEVVSTEIHHLFYETYIEKNTPLSIQGYKTETVHQENNDGVKCEFIFFLAGKKIAQTAVGNGPIDAFSTMIKCVAGIDYKVVEYVENALTQGSDAGAACYVRIHDNNRDYFGVGVHSNTTTAALQALCRSINHLMAEGG